MDLANITAAPSTIAVGGREFKVGPLRYLEMGCLQRWMNEHRSPNPPKIGRDNDWAQVLLSDLEGVEFFLSVLFGKHQELAEDDLIHILAHVGRKDINRLFLVAMEIEPDEEGQADPKA